MIYDIAVGTKTNYLYLPVLVVQKITGTLFSNNSVRKRVHV